MKKRSQAEIMDQGTLHSTYTIIFFYFRAPEPSGNVLLLLLILFKYFNYTPAEKDVFDKLFTEAPEKLEAVKRVRNEERK